MFKLSDKAIKEFIEVYLKEFDIRLSEEEANKLGVELLEFFKLIYRPIPKTDKQSLDKFSLTFKG